MEFPCRTFESLELDRLISLVKEFTSSTESVAGEGSRSAFLSGKMAYPESKVEELNVVVREVSNSLTNL